MESDNAAVEASVITVESDNAEMKNSLHFINAECRVIEGIYASILEEMEKSGRFQNF